MTVSGGLLATICGGFLTSANAVRGPVAELIAHAAWNGCAFSSDGPPVLAGPSDVRFVPERGVVQSIDPTGAVPLRVGLRGHVVAEIEFASDLVGVDGFQLRPLQVLWRVLDAQGRPIFVEGLGEPQSTWNGQAAAVEVLVESFDRSTGRCAATIELPVGGHVASGFGVLGRYPMLPDGGASIEFAVGWTRRIRAESTGDLTGVLAAGVMSFSTTWPDIWIGNESPRGPAQVGDSGFEVLMTLRAPAAVARTFEVSVQPSGVATVLTPTVVVPAGAAFALVSLRGERPGDYRLVVKEGGAVVAQSSTESIVRPQMFGSSEHPALWVTSAGLSLPDFPFFGDDEECVEGFQVGGGNAPVWEFCYACRPRPNPEQSCPGETGGNWALWYDAYCRDGDGSCSLAITPVAPVAYRYTRKRESLCFSETTSGNVFPFGVGAGVAVTREFSTWCCRYEYVSTGSGMVPGVSRAVCSH